MARPKLPNLTDPENTHFHPVFKIAAEEVIAKKGLAAQFSIKTQYPSPTGPIDLVIFNIISKKVFLPIEIKRTQSNVRGGGRRQARDYWQNLGANCETPYYCATNLELVELFRNDPAKPRTSAQRLQLSCPISGILGVTPETQFYDNLKSTIEEILDLARGIKNFQYETGLSEFQANIATKTNDPNGWHQLFIPVCFEYIRGAASQIAHLQKLTSTWKSAELYKSTPNRLLQLGSAIDFLQVFSAPATNSDDPIAFANSVIKEAFEAGKALGKGDDLAELVNELLTKPTEPGIVETDAELAQLLAVVARDALGRELHPKEEVLDPASGSGRLLTALSPIAFPSLLPSQIKANEKEKLFAEALSLRLGLAFGNTLSPANAPTITISGIETVSPKSLAAIRLVVMNPPYLSGVQASNIKGLFTNRIRTISGSKSKLDIGQAALEILFLELVWHLVPGETVIATVFPTQHLTRLSKEAVELRKFLIKEFSLTHIVIYPRQGLFETVIKQTVLLVGKKAALQKNSTVKLVEVQTNVGNIDLGQLLANLKTNHANPTHGVNIASVLCKDLLSNASVGWRSVIGAGVRANGFVRNFMSSYKTIESLGKNFRRGTLGNAGNTALTVFSKTNPKLKSVHALIPKSWLRPVLNTAENICRDLTANSAPEMSFLPPDAAYIAGTKDSLILTAIINEYLKVNKQKSGAQKKAVKTSQVIRKNLKSDQKELGTGWVLIPRGARIKGEISLLDQAGILLSTNIAMVRFSSKRERELFASWMLSVFGQMQLELVRADQEGMRKLELTPIKLVRFPNFSKIPIHIEKSLLANLPSEPPHTFAEVKTRPSDLLWAEIVAPSAANHCLAQAIELFQELVDERRGFGNS